MRKDRSAYYLEYNNRPEVKLRRREWSRNKYRNDPEYRLRMKQRRVYRPLSEEQKAKNREYHRQYYQKNREARLAREREARRANPEHRNKRRRYMHAYRNSHPELKAKEAARMRVYNKKYLSRIRNSVLQAYGAVCVCCQEKIVEFLTIDHINGGGGKHLKKRGIYGLLIDIIREGFPKDKYRILCMNCNWSRGRFGYCPHEREKANQ